MSKYRLANMLVLSVALVWLSACMTAPTDNGIKELHITSGSVRGVYYPVAHAIADAINRDQRELAYHISASSSHGSIANINNLLSRNADFAIVQYDVLLAARAEQGEWEGRDGSSLVAVARLYDEAVTLIAAQNTSWADLRLASKARVGIGSQGSGHHHNAQQVLAALGEEEHITRDSRVTSRALAAVGGELDAAFLTIGHPAPLLQQIMQRESPPRMISLPEDVRQTLIDQHPAFIASRIPAGSYGALPQAEIETVGLPAVLVCRADMPDKVVQDVVRQLARRLPALQGAHPVLGALSVETMASLDPAVYHPAVNAKP